jgi:hypothetical protein
LGCTTTPPLGSGSVSLPSRSGSSYPPSSDSTSGVEMWYMTPPAREKKLIIWINIELEDEWPHMKMVNPYVQMLNITITIFSLITFVDIFMFKFAN